MHTIHSYRHHIRQLLDQNFFSLFQTELTPSYLEKLAKRFAPFCRRRLWTVANSTVLWILSALQPEESFQAIVAEFWTPLISSIPRLASLKPSSARLSEARARVPYELLKEVRQELARLATLEEPQTSDPVVKRLLWIDGSGFSMPENRKLSAHFGRSRNASRQSLNPQGRIVNMGLVSSRAVIATAYGPYRMSEIQLTHQFIQDALKPGDLLLADSYYASAEMMSIVRDCGANLLCQKHSGVTVFGKKHFTEKIGRDDWIIHFRMRSEFYQSNPLLPRVVQMRVCRITTKKRGKTSSLWLQTTLLDSTRFPKKRLLKLFAQRWDSETSYEELKVQLHMGVLRSKTVVGVMKEIEAHLAAYNFVRLQLQRAAKARGKRGKDLSFIEGLRTIREFGRRLWGKSKRDLTNIITLCQTQLAAAVIRIRPGRIEPRALRRGRVDYPKLKGSRKEWRLKSGYRS